jgi:hypothetical protein
MATSNGNFILQDLCYSFLHSTSIFFGGKMRTTQILNPSLIQIAVDAQIYIAAAYTEVTVKTYISCSNWIKLVENLKKIVSHRMRCAHQSLLVRLLSNVIQKWQKLHYEPAKFVCSNWEIKNTDWLTVWKYATSWIDFFFFFNMISRRENSSQKFHRIIFHPIKFTAL